jgi:hypothetical protein
LPAIKFREEFPFLNEPGCPPELKILASDKITAWRNYKNAHTQLFDCSRLQQCTETARNVIQNKLNNELIYEELRYYQKYRKIYGQHEIFTYMRRLRELRALKPGELVREYENTFKNIYRYTKLIASKPKPHLSLQHQAKLKELEIRIAELESLLEQHGLKDIIKKIKA